MGAEGDVFDALHRLLDRLERYVPLPPGPGASVFLSLQSASVHAQPQQREPATEVVESPSHVYVTVEIPGVAREAIDLRATPDILVIRAAAGDRRFVAHVQLPVCVWVDSIHATYRNGVLDVSLEKDRGRLPSVR